MYEQDYDYENIGDDNFDITILTTEELDEIFEYMEEVIAEKSEKAKKPITGFSNFKKALRELCGKVPKSGMEQLIEYLNDNEIESDLDLLKIKEDETKKEEFIEFIQTIEY